MQASAEKLEHTGLAEKKGVASVPQRAVGKYAKPPLPKEESRLSRSPDRKVEESQGKRQTYLGEREGVQSGKMGKGGLHSERRERGQAKKASLGEVEGSMSG